MRTHLVVSDDDDDFTAPPHYGAAVAVATVGVMVLGIAAYCIGRCAHLHMSTSVP